MEQLNNIIYEDIVKTTNDGRIQLIENTIKSFERNKYPIKIDQYELYLILDEAISNAMEHGNKWNIEKKVRLTVYKPIDDTVMVEVEDEGNGFNPELIPQKISADSPLSPRGRGIIIIKKFCNIAWDKSGKIIKLFINLKK
jgi:serine/threonine-protein kinase RsbW